MEKAVKIVRRAQCAVRRTGCAVSRAPCAGKRYSMRSLDYASQPGFRYGEDMNSYQSLHVWQRAHSLVIAALRETDTARQPKTWAVFDQLRRAAVSVEANIVEGYALRAPLQFRRHLRIALGSAAETECLIRSAGELDYLGGTPVKEMLSLSDSAIGLLVGLLRRPLKST